MIKVSDIIDLGEYAEMSAEGYIREVLHPVYPYAIACYTKKAMSDNKWNNTTMTCRGLIWNFETGEILARPFQKFFNYGEVPEIDDLAQAHAKTGTPFEVTDKLDGSLGIIYMTPDGPAVATKGSFSSDQAMRATAVLRDRYKGWIPPKDFTVLTEIIYPENRIVLDYGDVDDLFLLGVIDNQDGLSCSRLGLDCFPDLPFPQTDFLNFQNFEEAIASSPRPNKEGVVIRFATDLRLKVKQEDYIELHKVCTGLNETQLWEWLYEGKGVQDILMDIPEELHGWARPVLNTLCEKFQDFDILIGESWGIIQLNEWHTDRKQLSSMLKNTPKMVEHGIYLLLDGNTDKYNRMIWKLVNPSGKTQRASKQVKSSGSK